MFLTNANEEKWYISADLVKTSLLYNNMHHCSEPFHPAGSLGYTTNIPNATITNLLTDAPFTVSL